MRRRNIGNDIYIACHGRTMKKHKRYIAALFFVLVAWILITMGRSEMGFGGVRHLVGGFSIGLGVLSALLSGTVLSGIVDI